MGAACGCLLAKDLVFDQTLFICLGPADTLESESPEQKNPGVTLGELFNPIASPEPCCL